MAPVMSAIDPSMWYRPEYGARLKPAIQFVFNHWGEIADEALPSHLHRIRDLAWPLGGYPCVGMWMFLLPGLAGFRDFPRILEHARQATITTTSGSSDSSTNTTSTSDSDSDPVILDLGCGLGQNLRLLAAHGIPTNRMVALDLEPRLWELGYELFKDRTRMQAQFIPGDFHSMPDEQLAAVQGTVELVIAAQFLHLFSREGQQAACKRIVALSRVGTMLVGFQQGRARPIEYLRPWGVTFYQNRESFTGMWEAVQEETQTVWEGEVREVDLFEWGMEEEDVAWMTEDRIGIEFMLTRVV
ncbi:class I SAM-dependent methyltransferase [Aspergillus saccharolyticus JOP 1030-1]|uniref:Methyltransferase domain-containing protein n=1 Tax=Aspergillus saccharolyticus JOP 1030-1 TaxID=1450539 RepID=A0A318ZVH6_9EURO|nr:hypothetical protein BP01DRAFT_389367 [Aspergillus saccharolyticus JOP 1030-1]PYH48060.1 hypothetical protein BP01DRAFT_389367 [Aspergillus saccharolyticus JOP 1030-1]